MLFTYVLLRIPHLYGAVMNSERTNKGTPFTPIVETYLNINEVRLNPSNNYVTYRNYRIPNQLTAARHEGRVVKPAKVKGTKTNLPKTHFFAALLLRNEILGCQSLATDKHFLIRNMRKEYPTWKNSAAQAYVNNFSDKRKGYNTGTLYSSQQMPPLYCFYWNQDGYIRHPKLKTQLLSFQYCKRHLTQEKFADPRFFTPTEISLLLSDHLNVRDNDWHIPLSGEISAIEAQIKKPIYDSIQFPSGYGKDFNPM
tara:strand:- start:10 stop:771 length:762 start_codon:yes stop_codon:yes gene_type:complete